MASPAADPPRPTDLSRYERPDVPGNRGPAWRIAWYVTGALLFEGGLLGLLPGPAKALILRAFGARIGCGLVLRPRVRIKYPWFLEIGDHVWIGEGVWIDNLCEISLGSHACVSQGAYLGTGNHDWTDPRFRFFARPVRVGEGAWIGARSVVAPGATVGEMAVLCAGSVLTGRAAARQVHAGNPARVVRRRRDAAGADAA